MAVGQPRYQAEVSVTSFVMMFGETAVLAWSDPFMYPKLNADLLAGDLKSLDTSSSSIYASHPKIERRFISHLVSSFFSLDGEVVGACFRSQVGMIRV